MRPYQAIKDKSSKNAKVHAPSCREPNGSRTISPRTKRFMYHYSKPPILQNVVQGFDTECGNSEGNAKSPVTLCLHSAPCSTVQRNWISRLGRYLMSQIGLKEQDTLSQEGIQPQGWALQDASNDSFVCYQDLLEYVGL